VLYKGDAQHAKAGSGKMKSCASVLLRLGGTATLVAMTR
jgi:hypothetical protein